MTTPIVSEQPRPRTSWLRVGGVVVLLTTVLTIVMIAFAWPATRSTLHDIPLGAAGPAPAAAQLEQRLAQARPGVFEVHVYADEAAARQAIEHRDVYGAVVLAPDGPEMLTASAASPVIAQVLTSAAQMLGAGQAGDVSVKRVTDVVPAPAQDPRGAGLAAAALPLVIGGIAAAGALTALVAGTGRRIVGALAFAVAGGLALTAVVQVWLGSLDGNYWVNSTVVALGVAATSLAILGLEAVLGTAGLGLGAATMLLLGNPLSGLASSPDMLPSGWGALGQLLPPGATGTLLRTVAFFPDAAIAKPVAVLLGWVAVGLVLLYASTLSSRRPRMRPAHSAASGLVASPSRGR